MAKTAVKPAGRRKRGAQTKMTLALFSMMLPGTDLSDHQQLHSHGMSGDRF